MSQVIAISIQSREVCEKKELDLQKIYLEKRAAEESATHSPKRENEKYAR